MKQILKILKNLSNAMILKNNFIEKSINFQAAMIVNSKVLFRNFKRKNGKKYLE